MSSPLRPVRLLHLSDLHVSERRAWDQDPVLASLADDVAELRQRVGGIDLVAVTGDIADRGQASEYDKAAAWLTGPLARAAGIDSSRIRVVPGNHDVDRSALKRAARTLDRDMIAAGDEAIAEVLADPTQRDLVLGRQANFLRFAARLHRAMGSPWWRIDEELGGHRVRLYGLNTSWLSGSHQDTAGEVDDGRRLAIGAWQWNELFAASPAPPDLAVALMHHPWEDLAEWDRRARKEPTLARCAVVLRGHQHEAELLSADRPGRSALELAAGACYADPRAGWPHGYQLLELDPREGRAKVYLRRWHTGTLCWIGDEDRYPGWTRDGVAKMLLRPSPRAPALRGSSRPGSGSHPLDDYRRRVRDRANLLAQVFHVPGGPTALSQVYVDPLLRAESPRTARVPAGPFPIEHVLATPGARWAVLGEPGSGKTSLLRNTALRLLDDGPLLPILLKVSELRGCLAPSLGRAYGARASEPARRAIARRQAVLLLDGLDEVADPDDAVAAVLRVSFDAGPCPIVLTSRPIGWQRPSPAFVALSICPLGRSEQRDLLEAWVPDRSRVLRALRRLRDNARLRSLAGNPFLLTLMAMLLREQGDLPQHKGELYERVVSILLTRAADPQHLAAVMLGREMAPARRRPGVPRLDPRLVDLARAGLP